MYCVHDSTRRPFSASGLENSDLGPKTARQNSSNEGSPAGLFTVVFAIPIPPASDDAGFLQPREVFGREAEQPTINILVVVAGRTPQPLQAARRLDLLERRGAVQDFAVVRRFCLRQVLAVLEVRELRHFVHV